MVRTNDLMKIEKINIIKFDERGVIYNCGASCFLSRKKGSVSADHQHEDSEVNYLVKGEIELTIGEETQIVKAPARIEMAPNEYHKLVALTNIEILIEREGEI